MESSARNSEVKMRGKRAKELRRASNTTAAKDRAYKEVDCWKLARAKRQFVPTPNKSGWELKTVSRMATHMEADPYRRAYQSLKKERKAKR